MFGRFNRKTNPARRSHRTAPPQRVYLLEGLESRLFLSSVVIPTAIDAFSTSPQASFVSAAAITGTTPTITWANSAPPLTANQATVSRASGTDFGPAAVGVLPTPVGPIVRSFTITNSGNANLNLPNLVQITNDTTHAFSVSTAPASDIAAGQSTTFTITFNPTVAGNASASVSIDLGGVAGGTYTFAIQGTGLTTTNLSGVAVTKTLAGSGTGAVTGNGLNMLYTGFFLDGKVFDASVNHNNVPLNFTLGVGQVIDGWDIGLQGIQAGEKRTLIIPWTLAYGADGNPNGGIPAQADLIFEVQAVSIVPPARLTVRDSFNSNFNEITNHDITPATYDGTDFGVPATNETSVTHQFVLGNIGGVTLTLSGNPVLTLSGPNAADFTITQPAQTTFNSYSGAWFGIKFTPSASGLRTATVTLHCNDVNNSTFEFAIRGGSSTDHAPTLLQVVKSAAINTPLALSAFDFTDAFRDTDANDTLHSVVIMLLPTHGTLALNSVPVTLNQEIPVGQLDTLTYTPATGFTGSDYFGWDASDGTLFSTGPVPATITVSNTLVSIIPGTTTMTEGDAAHPATFTVHRKGDISKSMTVYYLLTGTAGTTRYTGHQKPTVGWVTFAANQADAAVSLIPGEDAVYQGTQSVIATIYPITGYSSDIDAAKAQITLLDNEPVISVTTDNGHGTMTEGDAANPATFTVHRTGDTSAALTVYYLLGGTATTTRYTGHQLPTVGWVTFAPGSADAAITLVPGNDAIYQGSKTVTVTLYPLTTYGADANAKVAQATLLDNEPVISVTTDNGHGTMTEGDAAHPATFTAHRTGDTSAALTVYYLLGGTAATTRYTGHQLPTVGWVTFAPGNADASITLVPGNDAIYQGSKTVTVTLYPLTTYGADANAKVAQATLLDNEPVISVTTDNGHGTMTEGDAANPATFTVHRTGDTSAALTVYYLLGGTATTTRYTGHQLPTVGWVTFAPGNADASITLTPSVDDAIYQGTKTVTVTLYPIATYGADANAKVAQATLADNESVISISTDVGHDIVTEGNPATPATFTVHRTGDINKSLTVYYLLSGTSATSRYTGHQASWGGWVTFTAGQADAAIQFIASNDFIAQGVKTILVTLYPLTSYGIDSNLKVAQASIQDP